MILDIHEYLFIGFISLSLIFFFVLVDKIGINSEEEFVADYLLSEISFVSSDNKPESKGTKFINIVSKKYFKIEMFNK